MIIPPESIAPYIDYEQIDEDHTEMVAVGLPENLRDEFESFKKKVEQMNRDNPLTDF